jgi:ribosomal protein S18 acetylase RimI-like enzyme
VLQEYRGRGLGSALLRASLAGLREAGFARAYGVARAKTAASRFLYTKFGGQGERLPQDFEVVRKTAA